MPSHCSYFLDIFFLSHQDWSLSLLRIYHPEYLKGISKVDTLLSFEMLQKQEAIDSIHTEILAVLTYTENLRFL